jgi:hypothetical protein
LMIKLNDISAWNLSLTQSNIIKVHDLDWVDLSPDFLRWDICSFKFMGGWAMRQHHRQQWQSSILASSLWNRYPQIPLVLTHEDAKTASKSACQHFALRHDTQLAGQSLPCWIQWQ